MIANHHQGGAKPRSVSIQMYAKIAGVVVLIAFVVGGFGEAYAPSQLIVAGNAAATTHNIVTHDLFFRLGFVGYLGESITDVALAFLLYVLLRPVHAKLALLAVLFRLIATAYAGYIGYPFKKRGRKQHSEQLFGHLLTGEREWKRA